jgi:hypothetical protein
LKLENKSLYDLLQSTGGGRLPTVVVSNLKACNNQSQLHQNSLHFIAQKSGAEKQVK